MRSTSVAGQTKDFEFETLCEALESAASNAPVEAHDAIEAAANALHYLYVTGQFEAFREYLREAEVPVSHTVDPAHVFGDMEQAEKWLHDQSLPAWGTLVKVAGKTWAVGRRVEMRWVLLPSFTPQEIGEE
jgi:hypothetical protein